MEQGDVTVDMSSSELAALGIRQLTPARCLRIGLGSHDVNDDCLILITFQSKHWHHDLTHNEQFSLIRDP